MTFTTNLYQRHDHSSCPASVDGQRPKHRCRGRWVGVINYGRTKTKARDRRVIYGATKAEAQAKLSELVADDLDADDRSGRILTVGVWLDEWLETYKPLIKAQTRDGYAAKIHTYMKPLLGPVRLDRLTVLQVEQVEARLTMACPTPSPDGRCPHKPHHGLAVSTARQVFVILKDALADAVKAGHIRRNPAERADAPATEQNQREHLTTPLADAVVAYARTIGGDRELRALVALEMGLRPGEALGLTWGVVDLEAGALTIARTIESSGAWGTPKSTAGRRTIPLTSRTWAAAKALHTRLVTADAAPQPADRIFTDRLDLDRRRYKTLLASAGVPDVTLYSARQSAARRLEEDGVPARVAAQFLGHSNVNMTYRYQRGADVETLRKAIGA
jgi:integrase